jgi:HK97 family phage portal protein
MPTPKKQSKPKAKRAAVTPDFVIDNDRAFGGGGDMMTGYDLIRPGAHLRKGSEEILQAYNESPRLRVAIQTVAAAIAGVEWRVFAREQKAGDIRFVVRDGELHRGIAARRARVTALRQQGELLELPKHPMMAIFERANPVMSGKTALTLMVTHYKLVGEAFAIVDDEQSRSGSMRPVRMWPIPPTWVRDMPTEDKPYFTVSTPSGSQLIVPFENMFQMRDPNPADPYSRGVGVGLTLADEIDIDEHAAKMTAAFFQNSAIPNVLVSLKGANQATVERAKREFTSKLQGFRKAYQTHFTGSEMSVARLDTSFKDMALTELRKSERDTIVQVLGIPPEMVGIIENSNRSTIDLAPIIFGRSVVEPGAEFLRSELQTQLLDRFDSRAVLEFDSPVPADTETRRAVMAALPKAFKVDEVRELAGLKPRANGAGDGFLVTQGDVFVGTYDEIKQPIFGYDMAAGVLTNNEKRARMGLRPTEESWGGERTVGTYMPPGYAPRSMLAAPDVSASRALPAHVPAGVGLRSGLTKRQLRNILAALDVDDLSSTVDPVMRALIEEWGTETIEAIDDKLVFRSDDESVQEFVDGYKDQRLGELINETTKDKLASAIDGWDGEVDADLVEGVGEVFERARVERSQTIAAAEGLHISEFAGTRAMKQSGIVEAKEWIAVMDGRTREAHASMDGQIVGIDEPFEVTAGKYTGARAQAPGQFGIAGLDINCRCHGAPVFDPEDAGIDISPSVSAPVSADMLRRCMRGGIVTRRMPQEQRAAVWNAFDKKLRKWEARLADAFAEGFERQEKAVMAVLRAALG